MAEFLIADLKCPTCGREFEDKAVFRAHMEFHARKKPFKCSECNYSSESQHRLDQHMHKHDRSRFTCTICEATFKWKGNLTLHMKLHSGEGLHECEVCGKQCVTKSELARHMDRHNAMPIHKCKVCPKTFKHKQDLNQHMKLHTGVGLHKCKVCQHIFLSSKILRTHMESHDVEPKYECSECGKKFKSRAMWQHHGRLHTKENVCVCPFCGKMFPVQSKLNKHLETHSVEPMFQCNLCNLKYKHERALQRHLNLVHYDKGTYTCEVCGKKFPSPSTLGYHMDSHSVEAKYECPDCGEKFKHQRKLRYHMKLHTGEGLLNCPTCNKTFFTQSALTGHMAVHMDIQPFECSLCGKRYKHAKALQLHLEDHDGTRQRFQCPECDRTFKIKAELNQHMKLHTGQGLFRCEVCDKEYIKKCELISHMDTHSNEARYECTICEKKYRHKKDLRQHMRIHSANAYSCDQCDKKFATKQQLGFHIVAHTKEAPHVCKTCGARFKYECSLVKHYRQHMYPNVKKEKVVLDVKPGEKVYKKIIDEYKAKRRSAPVTKAEKEEEEVDNFAFPASPAPAANRRATVMPEIVEALDAEDVMAPSPGRVKKVVALQEPRLFQDPNEPPLETVFYEEVVTDQEVPPPMIIMSLEEVQEAMGAVSNEVMTEEVMEEVEQLEWDQNLAVSLKPSTRLLLKDLGLQVPNINLAVNKLFPAFAEKKKRGAQKQETEEIPESVELDKLVKVGILNEFGDPVGPEKSASQVQVEQKRKPVPLSKKPMPLRLKKVMMAKLHKKMDPSMAPALSKSPAKTKGGEPPILEKISHLLKEPIDNSEEEDGPPVLTKVQPAARASGSRRAAAIAASTIINTASPSKTPAAAARSPARQTALIRKASAAAAASPTKASKFKQEKGYEPYDWGFSDDETGSKRRKAEANQAAETEAKSTPRLRARAAKAKPPVKEDEEEEEEEEDEEEPVIQKVTTPRGRGRPRKTETEDSTPKQTPSKPKATPPTRSQPQRGAGPQTRTGPSKIPPKATPPTKAPPKATPPSKIPPKAASKAAASASKSAAKEDEADESPVKQLPLKKRPAAFKGPNTPQGAKKSAVSTPVSSPLDVSPVRKSSRSQKPTERMLEYLQDKALVGKVKTEPGMEVAEVTPTGKKFEGKVAHTKASKAEALKELKELKAKTAAMAKAKEEKMKKTTQGTKRKASGSPADAPPEKKTAEDEPKRGRGRPRKEDSTDETNSPTAKKKSAEGESPSKFKSRKCAAEMIEEFAAGLMNDLKGKAKAPDEDYDSEDEEQDPLKASSGKRSNRSGSISGRSNQEEADADSDVDTSDLNWEHSRIIRRRASSEEEDDDEEEDIKIIRRARRASSKSPKAKATPGRAFSNSPGASPGARVLAQPAGDAIAEDEDGEEEVLVQIRTQPLRETVAAAGVEIVEDLHDDDAEEGEAIENDHVEMETAEPQTTIVQEQYTAVPLETVQMSNGQVVVVTQGEILAPHLQEQVLPDGANIVVSEADGIVHEQGSSIEAQVGALKKQIAISNDVQSAEHTEAMVDEIRALTEQAQAAMKEVEAPQLQVQQGDLVEMQVDDVVSVAQLQAASDAHGGSILQVPDIRIQAPSPIVEHSDLGMAIDTPPSFDNAQAEASTEQVTQAATNGIGEELLGAISQATEEGTIAQTKASVVLPEQE